MILKVDCGKRQLQCGGKIYSCAIGKAGATPNKVEGDHKTPLGTFPIRNIFYRSDRLNLKSAIPLRATAPDDGWCDDSNDKKYNQYVKLPYRARHEDLWREDHVYDVVVVIGYNDAPVTPEKGSAIFLHVARDGYPGTEGCIALALPDLLEVVEMLTPDSRIEII